MSDLPEQVPAPDSSSHEESRHDQMKFPAAFPSEVSTRANSCRNHALSPSLAPTCPSNSLRVGADYCARHKSHLDRPTIVGQFLIPPHPVTSNIHPYDHEVHPTPQHLPCHRQ